MRLIANWVQKAVLILGVSLGSTVLADNMPAPTGDVILTINGLMTQSTTPDEALFDLAALKNVGAITFTTSTPWTEGAQQFTGVPLDQLLRQIGSTASRLKFTAINEYQVEVPTSDAVAGGPILAWEQNGKLLSVREKGPLWLIYPFDLKQEYRTEEVHSRAVWQVEKIELLP